MTLPLPLPALGRMSFRIFDPLIPSTRPPDVTYAQLTSRLGVHIRWFGDVTVLRRGSLRFCETPKSNLLSAATATRRRVCSGLIESNRTIIEPDRLLWREPGGPQTPAGDVVKRVTRRRFAARRSLPMRISATLHDKFVSNRGRYIRDYAIQRKKIREEE